MGTYQPRPLPVGTGWRRDRAAVTVERRWRRRLLGGALIAVLATAAYAAGDALARMSEPGVPRAAGVSPVTSIAVGPLADRPLVGPLADLPIADLPPGGKADLADRPLRTLRFEPFDQPTLVVAGETATDLDNSIGVDLNGLGPPGARAIVADVVVNGPVGSTISLHPEDRPADALRFTVPSSGRLALPHLVLAADDRGRIALTADQPVTATVIGHGRYVPAARATAGRFVATGQRRLGSLVTATDGRRLTVGLWDTLGSDAAHIGRAVIRVNANVGPEGGSVAVGAGPPIPWPAPASRDQGLAATELLTVAPTDAGDIVFDYLGGSVLTVDLVGYYTNDTAPESAAGLLVLAPTPELRTVDVPTGAATFTTSSTGFEPAATVALVVAEVINGHIDAPTGATLRIWTVGGYT